MKLIHYESVGRKSCCEQYESEEEFDKVNAKIERLWGSPIVNPKIDISKVKPRRYYIRDKPTQEGK